MSHLELDLLCVGNAAWDVVLRIPRQPKPNEKIEAEEVLSCGGGPAANASVCASRLGLRTGFAGYLSRDVYGQAHLAELRHAGVDLSLVSFGESPMRISTIYAKPDGQRSIVHRAPSAKQANPELARAVPWRAKAVLFDGYEASLAAAVLARIEAMPEDTRPITVLDAGSVREGTRLLAPRVDHLVASEIFAREFTGEDDPGAGARALAEQAPTSVVTLGETGAVWARRGSAEGTMQEGRVDAFMVEAVDSTGAGDAFHAGYAAALVLGKDYDEVLAWAAACGALACTKLGARPAMPDRAKLETMLTTR